MFIRVLIALTMFSVVNCSETKEKDTAPPIESHESAPANDASTAVDIQAPINSFNTIEDNVGQFIDVASQPLSTVSADVDTASFSRVRAALKAGIDVDPDMVRIEEFINYFDYSYPEPAEGEVVSVTTEEGPSPWNAENRLIRVGLKSRTIIDGDFSAGRNFVFLLDVSGSMSADDGLPLLQATVQKAISSMLPTDRISIVTYAGRSAVLIDGGSIDRPEALNAAIANLKAGGSTNGADGIKTAYDLALKHFIPGGVNRVVLGTDGDFNVGVSNEEELVVLAKEKAGQNIYLSILGFRVGGGGDQRMEKLSNEVNGNYYFIDSEEEAARVLSEKINSTFVTVAKDVKVQIEFNPKKVKSYRLMGYDNRMLNEEDFNDDTKDAGDMGSSHQVTYVYEIVPADPTEDFVSEYEVTEGVDSLVYQQDGVLTSEADKEETTAVAIRYKNPDSDASQLQSVRVAKNSQEWESTSLSFKLATQTAALAGQLKQMEGLSLDLPAFRTWLAAPEVTGEFERASDLSEVLDLILE